MKNGKWVKDLRLRTAYKSATTNEGLGQVDALMYRKEGIDYMLGYKTLRRPNGAPMFEKDFFRKKSNHVWKLPQVKVPPGLLCVSIEPGFWIFSPIEDMRYLQYKFLLQELPWEKVEASQRMTTELKFGKSDRFMIVDQLAFKGIENYINKMSQRIGLEKYVEDIVHMENDRARAMLYQEIYLEGEKKSLNDVFVEAGSLSRVMSNSGYVLRPKSEVFREIIKDEIDRLSDSSKKTSNTKGRYKNQSVP